jgi:ATP-dependent RNA helicase HelY
MPTPESKTAFDQVMRLWRRIRRDEDARGLDLTREPDPGFVTKAFRWASEDPLEDILGEDDAPGDFVRAVKQLIDLLRQLHAVEEGRPIAAKLGETIDRLNRGIVAYSSLDL